MFVAPPNIETRIFASLPQSLRIRNGTSAFARTVSKFLGNAFDSFLEGPSFDREGNLYCVDVLYGRILRVSASGEMTCLLEYDGEPNGLKIHRDGRLFIADRRHGIVVVDPCARRMEPLLDRVDMEPFRGPNDLVFSAAGDLYFTDQGMSDLAQPTGRVFCLRANGRLDLLLEKLPGPNGIALGACGRTLYVALTRSNSILRATVLPEGRVSRVQAFIQMSGGGGPDGIACDNSGGLAVAHPQMGAVWLFDSRGQPALRINLCRGMLGTNVAYGGPDGRHLYITESETATIQVAELPARGVTLFSHSGAS